MSRIKRALISVWNKKNLVPFAKTLVECGIEIISTGGTARALREAGLPVIDVTQVTGFPEILDGRVKTLHPLVHAALLFVRDNPSHIQVVRDLNITPIDLVVVNLYPFEQTVAAPGITMAEALENIDIGGPSMVRSAAKNYPWVTVVTDPEDYDKVALQIKTTGTTSLEMRRELAAKAFALTSKYDAAIASYLSKFATPKAQDTLPQILCLSIPMSQKLRYGENPHQEGGLYGDFYKHFEQLHGKELSYNNVLDISAAIALISEFINDLPTIAILKHTNPCGVGQANTLAEAWEKAFATDRQAPFGGIIVANKPMDHDCAKAISEIFTEVVIAPGFVETALEILKGKKNLRIITFNPHVPVLAPFEVRSVGFDSYLVQTPDRTPEDPAQWRVVTRRPPTESEKRAMLFGWRIVKHVKSNAIVFATEDRTIGVGAGQMSRIDACKLAIWKAQQAGLSLQNSVVCSDAFFPFPDGILTAAEVGATAVIQPGGSVRDNEVIATADTHNMAMVFTGTRHFKH